MATPLAAHARFSRPCEALLDADPDLGRALPPDEREQARRLLVAGVQWVPQGRWTPVRHEGALACLVLDGTLIRGARVGERWWTELLGREDVLRPWDESQAPAGLEQDAAWTALEPVRLAVLDQRFVRVAARWPALMEELMARAIRRSRNLGILMGVSSIRQLDLRLLILLRIIADRWGHVSPRGIELRLRLTHETLARLACAQRPSVSTALGRLTRAGLIRRDRQGFVLPLELPPAVERELARRRAA